MGRISKLPVKQFKKVFYNLNSTPKEHVQSFVHIEESKINVKVTK